MIDFARNLQNLAKQVNVQTNIETPSAALSLTRSATLALLATGTLITWQTEVRNSGFTWSGDTITIPTSGYYMVQTFLQTSANVTMFTQKQINGVNAGYFGYSAGAVNYHTGTMTRYFTTGDTLQIRVAPSGNVTLNVSADGTLNESPFLYIVQLSSSV